MEVAGTGEGDNLKETVQGLQPLRPFVALVAEDQEQGEVLS